MIACPAPMAGSVETLHEVLVDRGAKHRFDLVTSKVNFDRLKDRRKKRFLFKRYYFVLVIMITSPLSLTVSQPILLGS